MMNWRAFEHDPAYVLGKLHKGELDAMETVTRVLETQFFQGLLSQSDWRALAQTYPSPRKRHDVPLWVYLSSEIALKINARHGFKAFPYVLPCSGLRDAFGPAQVQGKRCRGAARDRWAGFNAKNAYTRPSPCDADYLRKMARQTEPERLQAWHNHFVAAYYAALGAYDPAGIFLADGTYLFVPDNAHYENADVLLFDEGNHPVSSESFHALSDQQKLRVERRRCYRKVALLHTSPTRDFYLYTGVKVMGGRDAEAPRILPLAQSFIRAVGEGVMKVLIFDRGLIDGRTIATLKREHGVDSVFPLKKDMQCWDEAWRLAEFSQEPWAQRVPAPNEPPPHPPQRPEYIRRREAARRATVQAARRGSAKPAARRLLKTLAKPIRGLRVWDACPVPIHAVPMRDLYDTGQEQGWVLATTMDFQDPFAPADYYRLRPRIEERIRQTKCFWDLTRFRSPSFSLVVNQVVFVLMAYSLVQIFLRQTGRDAHARWVRDRLFDELLGEQEEQHALYCDGRVAFMEPLEFAAQLLSLDEPARRKLLGRTRQLLAHKSEPPPQPWRP